MAVGDYIDSIVIMSWLFELSEEFGWSIAMTVMCWNCTRTCSMHTFRVDLMYFTLYYRLSTYNEHTVI